MAWANLESFNREIIRASVNIPKEQLSIVLRKIALEALTKLVLRTPVDTGRARGNWQLDIATASATELDVTGGGQKAPLNTRGGEGTAGADAINSGLSKLARIQSNPFTTIHIVNNVPYLEFLEAGRSDQVNRQQGQILAITFEELKQIFT